MQSIVEAFRMGGVWMYAIFAMALMTHLGGLVAGGLSLIAKPRHRVALVLLSLVVGSAALTTLAIGAAGYFVGFSEMEAALEKVTPENVEMLRARGTQIARYPLYFGMAASVFPSAVSVFVLFRSYLLDSDADEA